MRLKQTTRQHYIRNITGSFLLAGILMLLPAAAFATPQSIKGGLTVSPAIVNLVVPSGQQTTSSTVTLTNNYDKSIRLTAEWQSIDEATGRLIPSGPLDQTLAESLHISETDISIASQGTKQVTVSVQNSLKLAPGGHYAILMFTVLSNDNEKLGLQSALSVTVFIVKRDGIKTSITMDTLNAPHSLFSLPSKATVSITNTGNVHVVPRAAITLERNDELIAKAVVNEASSPLLPGKKASYTVKFTKLKNVYVPSRLKLRVVYRVNQSDNVQERTMSFWYIPPMWPFIILMLSIGLYFVVKRGKAVYKRIKSRFVSVKKHHSNKPQVTAVKPVTPKSSKIPVSSVEVSPTHTVPVGHESDHKKAKKAAHLPTQNSEPKNTLKKQK